MPRPPFPQRVGMDRRGRQIAVTEQLLDHAEILAPEQWVGGEGLSLGGVSEAPDSSRERVARSGSRVRAKARQRWQP